MKKNYNLDELEDFLSDSAEQHRMYPSDKVWRNIDQELHGSKKWPALTFGAILTGAIITAGLILVHPDKTLFTVNTPTQPTQKVIEDNEISNDGLLSADLESSLTGSGSSKKRAGKPPKTIASYPDNSLVAINGGIKAPAVSANNSVGPGFNQRSWDEFSNGDNYNSVTPPGKVSDENEIASALDFHAERKSFSPLTIAVNNYNGISEATAKPELQLQNLHVNESIYKSAGQPVNKLSASGSKNNRWSLLYYATPSISYRYLSEAKVVDLHLLQNGPIAPNFTNGVNKFVRHKSTLGIEIGGAVMYNLSPSFRVRTGLQLNIRGYSIEAFASKRETSTILLNRGYYTDSLVGISSISNQEGYKPMVISNQYLEVSIPLSIDLRVVNWKKIQLYVSAGAQPTYQFNESMFMISSDYKNYIQEPDLVRHFNVNTTLEAFMSYKIGGVTWQAGPQIRYQLLPGAINQYPVRERLIDYGFKIGVVKTLK